MFTKVIRDFNTDYNQVNLIQPYLCAHFKLKMSIGYLQKPRARPSTSNNIDVDMSHYGQVPLVLEQELAKQLASTARAHSSLLIKQEL